MVGIPRSKACIRCRARRKGCDGKKPACGNCTSKGVACPGYRTDLNIIFVDPGSKQSHLHGEDLVNLQLADRAASAQGLVIRLPPDLPRSCHQSAYRSQTYGRFFETYMPHPEGKWPRLETDLGALPSTAWLYTAVGAAANDDLLNNALTALALAQVERWEEEDVRQRQSPLLYGRAMKELAKRLNGTSDPLSDSTLAAVMAMSIYEMQGGSPTVNKASGWLSHVRGASVLVRLRGAKNFSGEFGTKLFQGSRLTELINAIGARKATTPSARWADYHTDPIPSDMELFEILYALPAIMEVSDMIHPSEVQSSMESCRERVAIVEQMYETLSNELWRWYTSLKKSQAAKLQPELFWHEPSTLYAQLPPDSTYRIFPTFLCFANLDLAEQIMLYWAGLLLMHLSMVLTNRRLRMGGATIQVSLPNYGKAQFDDIHGDTHQIALHITQALEFFVHPDMGLLGTKFVGLPLTLALGYFTQRQLPERLWFEVIRARLRAMKTGLSDFLDSMANQGGGIKSLRLLVP